MLIHLNFRINSILNVLKCCLFFSISLSIYSQNIYFDQKRVDSLKDVLDTEDYSSETLKLFVYILNNETDPEEKLTYSKHLINSLDVSRKKNLISQDSLIYFSGTAYLEMGNALQLKGEFHEALESFFKAKDMADEFKDKELSTSLLISIADTYSMIGNSESAQKYYSEGINGLRKVNDSLSLASALLNAGDEYYKTGQYDRALTNFEESGQIFENLDYQIGKAYNLGNTGMVYAKQGKDELAANHMNEAIAILEENEDYYAISEYLIYMSDLYQEQSNFDTAIAYGNRSLDLAKKFNLKDQISDANLQLSELMENAGDHDEALDRYKDYVIYRDSVINLENVQKMANLEVDKKQLEVENLEQKRKNQRIVIWSTVGILLLTTLMAYGLYKRHKFVKATNKIIAAEKQRSDDLLLNILPEDTAKELKDKGRVEAKKYPQVTVLFSDFKGFTKYAENLSPEVLVKTIDHYFSEFDLIMEKYGLEKIKTIGDAYMAAGGLNFDNEKHAEQMILAAKEMNDFVHKAKHDDSTDATFDIRIGINTGPVVAGVVGTKKFAYDIWGDTVNIAARMESNSAPGRINISEDTYNMVQNRFNCEFRGKLAVKNRGELNMYFVNS